MMITRSIDDTALVLRRLGLLDVLALRDMIDEYV
jgi:hypothetical protein